MSRLCECGCGSETPLAMRTRHDIGHVKGQPIAFVRGHNARRGGLDYDVVDTGYDTRCWLWLRSSNETGYAMATRDGKSLLLHRWEYEQAIGPIPEGMTLDHLCRQRRCCNPAHLDPVPLRENIWRGWEARYAGQDHNEMRAERLRRRLSQRQFADLLGISQTAVSAYERGTLSMPVDWSSRLRMDERENIGGETYGRRPMP